MSIPVRIDIEAGPGSLHREAAACDSGTGCITCGDVAVELVVVHVFAGPEGTDGGPADAICRDGLDRTEIVATELVGPVEIGDRLLVHAGVALERLTGPTAREPSGGAP